ncbi:MAG: cytochrome c3 family protein [Phycisphaerales bacterium]|nr:MAG: cytochrome c3 family protein [Phycisphaerales bacterium]
MRAEAADRSVLPLVSIAGLVLAVLPLVSASTVLAQGPPENDRCLNCHGSATLVNTSPAERALMVRVLPNEVPREDATELLVFRQEYDFSVHREIGCTECHLDCEELPHAIRTEPAQCVRCHPREDAEYSTSTHGKSVAAAAGTLRKAAYCSDCHGTHNMLSSKNQRAPTYKLQLPLTCAKCHSNPELMTQVRVHQPLAAEQYLESMHGRGLMRQGLIIAPSCNDCHGVHEIWPASDRRSRIHRDNVPHTCGACHVGVTNVYDQSIHGRLVDENDERAPVCTTCHTAHDIINPEGDVFKLASDDKCGRCHEKQMEKYRETFHGKAAALGLPGAAACFDCHGQHDILRMDEPGSILLPENRIRMCRKCHPRASDKFAGYIAHADHSNRENYPVLYWTFLFMSMIIVGTFSFFGLHTVFWFVRSGTLYMRDRKAFRETKTSVHEDDVIYVRFRPFDRFLHFLIVTSFLLLAVTGMPLKFYETEWAEWVVWLFGGLEVTTALHRAGGIITFLYLGLHVLSMISRSIQQRYRFRDPTTGRYSIRQVLKVAFGPEIPFPNPSDVGDWWAHQKWFFGRGPRPQWDRWTYWEKFDYMAVFWGVGAIGLSGLVMWFPVEFTWIFPGWLINMALIIHSDEALLAAGFIFTFHFFNGHFRIEKFPMDTVIFSGRITRAEMLHERKRWYDRLEASGELEKIRLKDEWRHWKKLVQPMGFIAFSSGVVLVVLIFLALASRLGSH